MVKEKLIAGVDIGSSSIKWAIYYSANGKILDSGSIRYPHGTFDKDNIDVNTIAHIYLRLLNNLNDRGVSYVGMSTMAPILVCINSEKLPLTGISEFLFIFVNKKPLRSTIHFVADNIFFTCFSLTI